jgi:S-adenosylmethionine hydrolase
VDERVCVLCGDNQTRGIRRAYGQQAPGTLTALINSGGYLELAVVDGSAAKRLDLGVGAAVTVAWDEERPAQ